VVPPELSVYVQPRYPREAVYSGQSGIVQLELTVSETGSVLAASIVSTNGLGADFEREALAATAELRFEPATVDGIPRSVRIGFSFEFTAPELLRVSAEEPAPPEPTQAGQAAEVAAGQLSGRILLAGADTPLPGILVRVVDDAGSVRAASTDQDGRFTLPGLPPGYYSVEVRADGFPPLDFREEVLSAQSTDVTYRLAAITGELEVVVQGERPPREVTRRRLERREISRIPGTSGDALRSLQSLPGVARPPGLAGLLIVRGSAPADSETFVDGTDVPIIYHFGGLSSVVPTDMLEKIDFYPGNFSVRYGRLQGGVVDVGLRAPRTECFDKQGVLTGKDNCFHGMAQVDFIDTRLMLEGPIAGDWKFAIAGRRSWIDMFLRPALEASGSTVTNAPVYYDYQAIVERDRGPDDRLSFRFFGSDDRFETIITNPAASDPGFGGNLRFGTSFARVQGLYRKRLSKEVDLDAVLSVGTQSIDFGLGGNLKFVLDSIPITMRSELGFQLHPSARLNVGLDFQASPFELYVRAPPPGRDGEAAAGPLATQVPLEQQTSGTTFRPGWYADLEWQPLERLRLVPGIRVDGAQDTGSIDVSPRVNVRYTLIQRGQLGPSDARETVLKGGFGKFSQPPAFQESDEIFGTPGIESNDSYHYSVGVEQRLSQNVRLSVEGFYKDFQNSVSRGPNAEGTFTYNNQGDGRVVGLETLLKYDPDDRFFGWVAYTLSESVRQNCPTCPVYLFQYDQTHNFVILGSYRLGRGWEIGARFRLISGPLATPIAQPPALASIFAGDAGSYVPIEGDPYSVRLPLFHAADVRIDKHWSFGAFRLTTYLDVQNVYNNMAAEGFVYNFDFSQVAQQTGLPIIPSLGMRGEF
jgi:TonB family protein